jgi:hypothetical protein
VSIDEIVGLIGRNAEFVPLSAGLNQYPPSGMGRMDLYAAGIQPEVTQQADQLRSIGIRTRAGDQHGVQPERAQMPRHVQGRASGKLLVGKNVEQHFHKKEDGVALHRREGAGANPPRPAGQSETFCKEYICSNVLLHTPASEAQRPPPAAARPQDHPQ